MSLARGIVSNGLATVVLKLVRIADQLLLVPFFCIRSCFEFIQGACLRTLFKAM